MSKKNNAKKNSSKSAKSATVKDKGERLALIEKKVQEKKAAEAKASEKKAQTAKVNAETSARIAASIKASGVLDGAVAEAAISAASPTVVPKAPSPVVNKSTVAFPSKLVWEVADKAIALNPEARRVDIVKACIAMGIATHTARTQYQHWYTARKATQTAAAEQAAK